MGSCTSLDNHAEVEWIPPNPGKIPSLSRPLAQQFALLHSLARTDRNWMFEHRLLMIAWQEKYWGDAWPAEQPSSSAAATTTSKRQHYHTPTHLLLNESRSLGRSQKLVELKDDPSRPPHTASSSETDTAPPPPPQGASSFYRKTGSGSGSAAAEARQQQVEELHNTLRHKKHNAIQYSFHMSFAPPRLSGSDLLMLTQPDAANATPPSSSSITGETTTAPPAPVHGRPSRDATGSSSSSSSPWREDTDGSWMLPLSERNTPQHEQAMELAHRVLDVVAGCFVGCELRQYMLLPPVVSALDRHEEQLQRSRSMTTTTKNSATQGTAAPETPRVGLNNNNTPVTVTRVSRPVFTAYRPGSDDGEEMDEPSPFSITMRNFWARTKLRFRGDDDMEQIYEGTPKDEKKKTKQLQQGGGAAARPDKTIPALVVSPTAGQRPQQAWAAPLSPRKGSKYEVSNNSSPTHHHGQDGASPTRAQQKKPAAGSRSKPSQRSSATTTELTEEGGEEADRTISGGGSLLVPNGGGGDAVEKKSANRSAASSATTGLRSPNAMGSDVSLVEDPHKIEVEEEEDPEAARRGSLRYTGRAELDEPDFSSPRIQQALKRTREWVSNVLLEAFFVTDIARQDLPSFHVVVLDSTSVTSTDDSGSQKPPSRWSETANAEVYRSLQLSAAVECLLSTVMTATVQREMEQSRDVVHAKHRLYGAAWGPLARLGEQSILEQSGASSSMAVATSIKMCASMRPADAKSKPHEKSVATSAANVSSKGKALTAEHLSKLNDEWSEKEQ